MAMVATIAQGAEAGDETPLPDAIVLQADSVEVDENENTTAEGNVSIELPQGTLRTQSLTYNAKDGVITIPGPFVIDTHRGTLKGTNLRYSLTEEKGGFDNVIGSYKAEEGVFFYFTGETGKLERENLSVEKVKFSNYSPIEKAGAQIRVERLGFLGSGKSRMARLERIQVYFLGVRLAAIPRYERRLATTGENPLFVLPIIGFHRDAGVLAGLRWYVPYKSLLIGVGGAYSTKLGGLPNLVVLRDDSLQAQAWYGRYFLVNEIGRGKEVFFEPLVSLGYGAVFGKIQAKVAGTYAKAKEEQTESQWQGVQGSGSLEILHFRNVRLVASADVQRDVFETTSRSLIRSRVGLTSETRRRGYFVGYLNTNHRGASPFVFQEVRDRESGVLSYRRRISPSFEIYAYGDYDLDRRKMFSHTYTLKYYWRGVMFGFSVNPEFKNYNFLMGLDGL